MNPFEYILRKFHGLPTVESRDLIAARLNATSTAISYETPMYDPHIRSTDTTMFGAIALVQDDEDLMSGQELHDLAQGIVESHGLETI